MISTFESLGDEFLVNTTTDFDQESPTVVAIEGGFAIGWADFNIDTELVRILTQQFDFAGVPVIDTQEEEVFSNFETVFRDAPEAERLSDGTIVIAFYDAPTGDDTGFTDILAARVSTDGETVNEVIQGTPADPNLFDTMQAIVPLDNAGFVLVTSSFDVETEAFDTGGGQLRFYEDASGPERIVDLESAPGALAFLPDATALTDGSVVAAWIEVASAEAVSATLFIDRFSQAGDSLWSTPVRIDEDGFVGRFEEVAVAGLAGGGFAVAWTAIGQGDERAYTQVFAADGTEAGPIRAMPYAGVAPGGSLVGAGVVAEYKPAIAGLPDGGFVVAWAESQQNGARDVVAQRFGADGAPVGPSEVVSEVTFLDQGEPDIAVLDNGSYVITWQSDGQDGDGLGIYARIFVAQTYLSAESDSFRGTADAEVIRGGSGNDSVFGARGEDTLLGGSGNDLIEGMKGDDMLSGGAGDDTLRGGAHKDALFGEANNDRMAGGQGDDTLEGGSGNDTLRGANGVDSLVGGDDQDFLLGGRKDDVLKGGRNADRLDGQEGNDLLDGGFGADTILGSDGRDTLIGWQGNDVLDGGRWRDVLRGDGERDTFVLRVDYDSDTIEDFTVGEDILALDEALWADEGTLTARQVVDTFTVLRDGAIVLDFGRDEFVLLDVTETEGLARAIDFL